VYACRLLVLSIACDAGTRPSAIEQGCELSWTGHPTHASHFRSVMPTHTCIPSGSNVSGRVPCNVSLPNIKQGVTRLHACWSCVPIYLCPTVCCAACRHRPAAGRHLGPRVARAAPPPSTSSDAALRKTWWPPTRRAIAHLATERCLGLAAPHQRAHTSTCYASARRTQKVAGTGIF